MSFSVEWLSWPVIAVLAGSGLKCVWSRFLSVLDYRETQIKACDAGYEEAAGMHPRFREIVTKDKFMRTADYAKAYMPIGIAYSAFDKALGIALLAVCAYPYAFSTLQQYGVFSASVPLTIAAGAYAISLFTDIVSSPFGLYETFSIETRFGFNRQTLAGWMADFAKEQLIGAVTTTVEIFAAYYAIVFACNVVDVSSLWFALGAAAAIAAYGMAWESIWISLVAPMFNKFTPLDDEDLASEIEKSLAAAGYGVSGIYVMDASRRSTHGNAYFCGWGKRKRIVIYDVLLEKHSKAEVMAVINHEIGHLSHGDIARGRVIDAVYCAVWTFLAARLVADPELYRAFGFSFVNAENLHDWYIVGFALAGAVIGSVSWLLTPLFSWLSRRDEFAADGFAAERGTGDALAVSLMRMYADNLSGVFDHWLTEVWFADHPGLRRRVAAISGKARSGADAL